jgi:hypothetical protein
MNPAKLFIISLLLVLPRLCFAAPYPGTSSSALTDPNKLYWLADKNYRIKLPHTNWIYTEKTATVTRLKSLDESPMVVSFFNRPDKDTKHSLVEYTNLGFEVTYTGNIRINKHPAQIIDLIHRENKKQLRQIVTSLTGGALYITCSSSTNSFLKQVKICNEIFASFTNLNGLHIK